jgi:hypothetical protein
VPPGIGYGKRRKNPPARRRTLEDMLADIVVGADRETLGPTSPRGETGVPDFLRELQRPTARDMSETGGGKYSPLVPLPQILPQRQQMPLLRPGPRERPRSINELGGGKYEIESIIAPRRGRMPSQIPLGPSRPNLEDPMLREMPGPQWRRLPDMRPGLDTGIYPPITPPRGSVDAREWGRFLDDNPSHFGARYGIERERAREQTRLAPSPLAGPMPSIPRGPLRSVAGTPMPATPRTPEDLLELLRRSGRLRLPR